MSKYDFTAIPKNLRGVLVDPRKVINDKSRLRPALYLKTPEGLIEEWKVVNYTKEHYIVTISGFINQPRSVKRLIVHNNTKRASIVNKMWKEKIRLGYTHNLETLLTDDIMPLMKYEKLRPRVNFTRPSSAVNIPYIQPLKGWLRIGIVVRYGRVYMYNLKTLPLFCNKLEKLFAPLFSIKDWVMLDCEISIDGLNNTETNRKLREHNNDYNDIDIKLCINDYYDFYKSELRFPSRYAIMEELVKVAAAKAGDDSILLGKVERRVVDRDWMSQYSEVAIKTKGNIYKPGCASTKAYKYVTPIYEWWLIKDFEIVRNIDKLGVRWVCIDTEGNTKYLDPRSARNQGPELLTTAKEYIGKKVKVGRSKYKYYSTGEFKD